MKGNRIKTVEETWLTSLTLKLEKYAHFLPPRRLKKGEISLKKKLPQNYQKELEELLRIQTKLAKRVVVKDRFKKPITAVAGIDLAFLDELAVIACVMVDYESLEIRFKKTAIARLEFPYVPTLLSFREAPPIIDLINSLKVKSPIFLINSHGLAHPRLCGCASQIGVLADVPSIGVATRNLCGTYAYEPIEVGKYSPIYHNGKNVGWIFKSKKGCKPIFISPGHLISLRTSLAVIKKCMASHKLPEPLFLAHTFANEEKRKIFQFQANLLS